MDAIILLGAPGSGKGTAAERLRTVTGYIHVSTGDMLRKAVEKGTPVGREAESFMKRGELVPDELVIKLIRELLEEHNSDDIFMFDGFPRTAVQAELLEQSLYSYGGRITHVFFFTAPLDVLIERLSGRRICRKCGTNYHVANLPPKKEGVCDVCGGELYQRPDDDEATISNRLEVYDRQTESLISRYDKQHLLVRIDSNRSVEEIAGDITRVLEQKG